jgi:signal transduction histidine kinase
VVRTVTGELRLAKRTSDFVSNVTHELKTPLTAIRMFVETLQDGRVKDDSERRECLDVIARETDRLQERIERVLKLAQLGAGQGAFDLHPGSLTGVLRDAADTCRARLTGVPGAELVEEIEEDLGPVRLDRRAMGEAVANLLANAVKYSPRDRCRLELVGRTDGDEVVVEVRDHGYGIPASEHERIFERFYRVDEPRVREVEGTGLGLALVRRIVEAHGGRMSLRSAEGEGSTFRIHLPVAAGTVADVRTT